MDMRMPETCWDVLKRQAINLRDWCIWLVNLFEYMMMHGLTTPEFSEVFTHLQKRESNIHTHLPYVQYLTSSVTMRRKSQWRLNRDLRLKWLFSLSELPTPWRRRWQHLPYHLKFINVFDQSVSSMSRGSPTYYFNCEMWNVRCYGLIKLPSPKNAQYAF
jgi:hypothetical protein